MTRKLPLILAALALSACGDATKPEETNAEEVITTVTLSFTPLAGGEARTFRWEDLEGSGYLSVDPITLLDSEDYALRVAFLNALEEPAEDITAEVEAEAEEHQVLFTGDALSGPAAGSASAAPLVHAYADTDANGLPVGLANTFETRSTGSGTLTVTLRHLPEEGGTPTKTAGLAEAVSSGGFGAIPGESDVSVEFQVTVE
jgi:hypothetical protein